MVKLSLSLLLLFLLCGSSLGALYLNYEEDLRGYYTEEDDINGEIRALSGSIRKIFADDKGDRFILYLQGELEHNLQERMIHQLYGRYKGPMGKWNISLGRVQLPWGLRTGWSPERMPYSSPYSVRGELMNDMGFMVSGTIGMVDYGVSLTQGYGMDSIATVSGPGLVTMRVGVTPLISGDLTLGVSFSNGTSHRAIGGHHEMFHPVEHLSGIFDATAYWGRAIFRLEAGAEKVTEQWEHRGFIETEYQLLPKLAFHGSGNVYSVEDAWHGTIFVGASTKIKSLTLRGGFEHEENIQDRQKVVIQLFRQFSANP